MDNQILKVIADNPALCEALRKLFEKEFSVNEISTHQSNEEMGQIARAKIEGLRVLAVVLREINQYKTIPEQVETKNPAR